MRDSVKIVSQALSFEKPDRIPVFEASESDEFVKNWLRYHNKPETACFRDFSDIDLFTVRPDEVFFPSKAGEIETNSDYSIVNDGWGRTIEVRSDACFSRTVERIIQKHSDLDKIQFEPADIDSRYTEMLALADYHRNYGRAVFVNTGGPYIRSCFCRGQIEFSMDLASDKSFARELAERVGNHLMNIGLEAMKRAHSEDFGIWIYDDMCNLKSPMFSPQVFEEIFLPIYKRMVSAYKKAGARWVILHCDGNLKPFLDMIVEAGIDGINPVEYAAGMDIVELADKYHKKLSFIGGVCNTHILPSGNKKEIEKHVMRIAERALEGGIVVGTHSLRDDILPSSFDLYRAIINKCNQAVLLR